MKVIVVLNESDSCFDKSDFYDQIWQFLLIKVIDILQKLKNVLTNYLIYKWWLSCIKVTIIMNRRDSSD